MGTKRNWKQVNEGLKKRGDFIFFGSAGNCFPTGLPGLKRKRNVAAGPITPRQLSAPVFV